MAHSVHSVRKHMVFLAWWLILLGGAPWGVAKPISKEDQEKYALIAHQSSASKKFQTEMTALLKRLVPTHDFKKFPIRFVLSGDPQPNAWVQPKHDPPIICFTKAMLNYVSSLDQLAYILNHEYTHFEIKSDHNSKGEEYLADNYQLKRLHEAGFDIREAIEIQKRFVKDHKNWQLTDLLGPHLLPMNRLAATEKVVAVIDQQEGGLSGRSPTPVSQAIKDIADSAKYESHFDKYLSKNNYAEKSNEQKMTLLKSYLDELGANEDLAKIRSRDLLRALRAIKENEVDTASKKILESMAEKLIDSIEQKKLIPQGSALYVSLSRLVRGQFIPARPIAQLTILESHLRDFVDAKTAEEAKASATKAVQWIEKHPELISLVRKTEMPGFALLDEDTLRRYRNRRGKYRKRIAEQPHLERTLERPRPPRVSWNAHVKWGLETASRDIAALFWMMDIPDPRLDELVPASLVLRAKESKGVPTIGTTRTDGLGVHEIVISETGRVSKFSQDPQEQERKQKERVQARALYELAEQAFEGNNDSMTEFLKHRPKVPSDSALLFVDRLEENPEAFFKINELQLTSINQSIEEGAKLVRHLANLLKRDKSKYAPMVRELILTRMLAGDRLNAKYPITQFVVSDTHKIFSTSEKLRYLNKTTVMNIFETEYEPFLPTFRKLLGYSEPTKSSQLLAVLQKLSEVQGEDWGTLRLIEIQEYLEKYPKNSLNVLEAIRWVSATAIMPHDLRNALSRAVERAKWPTDPKALTEVWLKTTQLGIWPGDRKLEHEILERTLITIEASNDREERLRLRKRLLAGPRIHEPILRQRLLDGCVSEIAAKHGMDTGSSRFQEKLLNELDGIEKISDVSSRVYLFSEVANAVTAQKKLSSAIGDRIRKVDHKKLQKSHSASVLGEGVVTSISAHSEHRTAMLEFLTSPLTTSSQEKFVGELGSEHNNVLFPTELRGYEFLNFSEKRIHDLLHANAAAVFNNFWSAPFPVRTALLDGLLNPSNAKDKDKTFQKSANFVMDELFPAGERYAEEAKLILQQYTKVIPEYQRGLLLSALMAAKNVGEGQERKQSIGERLSLLFELMGPAETKLGQVIHSHPKTPNEISDGMGRLKKSAAVPFRWDLLELFEEVVPKKDRQDVKRVATKFRAASYFVVFEVELKDGSTDVFALLRPNARKRAENGFSLLVALAERLKSEGSEISDTLIQMIKQAREMAKVETDHKAAEAQYKKAKELYSQVKVTIGEREFEFYAVDLKRNGPGYRRMSKADGVSFSELAESTDAERAYKRDVARALLALEFSMLLSGKEFDHDRHGEQMKVKAMGKGGKIGLFDFGALSLNPPSKQERVALADLLFEVVSEVLKGGEIADRVHAVVKSRLTKGDAHADYLLKVQKAVLALGDYVKFLGESAKGDVITILKNIATTDGVHEDIKTRFMEHIGRQPGIGIAMMGCEQHFSLSLRR